LRYWYAEPPAGSVTVNPEVLLDANTQLTAADEEATCSRILFDNPLSQVTVVRVWLCEPRGISREVGFAETEK